MKMGVEYDVVWSEKGSGVGELGGRSPSKIARSTSDSICEENLFLLLRMLL